MNSIIAYRLKQQRKFLFFYTVFLFFICCFPSIAFATELEDSKPPIICDGDRVEYLDAEKKVIGTGNVVIQYEEMKLTAQKVTVDMQTRKAQASGNVTLHQGENVFRAENISYDFEAKKGTLINAQVTSSPWHGKCKEAEQVSENEIILKNGYITTCDKTPPHYSLKTKRIKIYLGDKIEAKNVSLCAGPAPVMFIPFYTHPIHDKKPEVTFLPGHKKDWGAYLLTAWRYYLNKDQQGKIHLDQRQKKGFAGGLTHNYNFDKFGKGLINGYYMQERDREKNEGMHAERQRYRFQLRHKWDIDEKTQALAEYHEFTDASFTKDYFYREEYEEDPQPKTYLSLIRANPNYSLTLLTQKRANRFFDQTEYLPQASFNAKNLKLGTMPLYYKGEVNIASLAKKNASSGIDDDVLRLDTYDELSYALNTLDVVSLKPYLGTRQTWYSRDSFGEEDINRGAFYTGLDLSTRFYKVYEVESKFLDIPIHSLRHILNPIINYEYIHDPTVSSSNLAEFDDIDTISGESKMKFSIENKLQTKPDPDEILDLATLIFGTEYLFKPEQGSELSDITADLEINPSDRFLLESDASFDPHASKIKLANIDFVTKKGEDWKLGIGHRYQRGESNELTFDGLHPVTDKIKLHCYQRYQFQTKDLKEQEYGRSFDLHCWVADLNYNESDGSSFWLTFKLKAFPETPFKIGTTYHKPKPTVETR